jgi:hypothetical protein
MIRASVKYAIEVDRAATKWSNRSAGAPLASPTDSTSGRSEENDDLARMSLSGMEAGAADIDREICRLALVRVEPSDDQSPPACDRWM